MSDLTLIQQLTAIPNDDFINVHVDGEQINERCIDFFFDPRLVEIAGRKVIKIKPNLSQIEIFLL